MTGRWACAAGCRVFVHCAPEPRLLHRESPDGMYVNVTDSDSERLLLQFVEAVLLFSEIESHDSKLLGGHAYARVVCRVAGACGHRRDPPRGRRDSHQSRAGRWTHRLRNRVFVGAFKLFPPPARRKICERVLRSEEHTSELQSPCNLVCRLLLE